MAKVVFKKDQPVQSLSGTYCGMVYKTLANGSCTAFLQSLPSEEEADANPAARAERVIKIAVSEIQSHMVSAEVAIKQYAAIVKRVRRLYKQLHELEEVNDRLVQMIMNAYYQYRRVLPSRKIRHPTIEFE